MQILMEPALNSRSCMQKQNHPTLGLVPVESEARRVVRHIFFVEMSTHWYSRAETIATTPKPLDSAAVTAPIARDFLAGCGLVPSVGAPA